jgi:hypothetical protein
MMNQESLQNQDNELAEKCRKALEKSLGIDIPLPKYMVKKANMPKAQTFWERKNVQKIDYLKR